MPFIGRSEEEINSQLDKASEAINNGTNYPGMSYEEGVQATIEWLTGNTDELPIEEEI